MTKSNAKKARLQRARKQRAAAGAPKQEAQPLTTEVLYEKMARSFATTLGEARRCGDKSCRRARRCVGPDQRCVRDIPAGPPPSPEEQAELQAVLREALKKRLAEFQAAREQGNGG